MKAEATLLEVNEERLEVCESDFLKVNEISGLKYDFVSSMLSRICFVENGSSIGVSRS